MGGGIGSILYTDRGGTEEFFAYNAVGDTVALTDGTGAAGKTDLYEAFGNIVSSTGSSANNRLANTKERDFSIGLDNHGFRYFDPEVGRYISRDPLGYKDGLDVYLYVHNNPINFVDPLGLQELSPEESEPMHVPQHGGGGGPAAGGCGECVPGGGFEEPAPSPKSGTGAASGEGTGRGFVGKLWNALTGRGETKPSPSMGTAKPADGPETGKGTENPKTNPPSKDGPSSPRQQELPMTPGRTEGKTEGVLVINGEQTKLLSGVQGPAQSMPKGSPGQDIVTKTHVEGHAAALMRQTGANEATLYLNNSPCGSCNENLPSALPPNSTLRVVAPDGRVTIYHGNER